MYGRIITIPSSKTESKVTVTYGELQIMLPLAEYQDIADMTPEQKYIARKWINAIVNRHRPFLEIESSKTKTKKKEKSA